MKKIIILILSAVTLTSSLVAHSGHGSSVVSSNNPAHWLLSFEHLIPISVVAFLAFGIMKKIKQRKFANAKKAIVNYK